ncbi:isopentenyl-diphosphate Delta-isomerase [Maribius pontilimi]|uniref:Isopentenyl-diphosphate Delta-isomerase n=1 Tax=Palleronia pontilimi TaxID=1964209 RepID=A0A934IF28_9RHOB|nr:isopentenyl-diphosphate Delta-isomerase [Palleronia pontilimi]MBJ3761435.1 isopentenyl-diphosphate Delta-isomerase [Palleronia pontilimi]
MIPAWIDGVLTPVEKLKAHQRGLRHRAISVFVMDGDAVLLQQRALGKYHTPGLWTNTCCTHPHWGEDGLDCAVRRLSEELGIVGVTPEFQLTAEYRAPVGGGLIEHEVVEIYTAPADRDLTLSLNPDEVAAVRWVSLPALRAEVADHPDHFTPWLRIYLDRHATSIFGQLADRSDPAQLRSSEAI